MGVYMIRMVLVGNPNVGKTTLFNALTGDHQRVGNWPGVTVEKKTGQLMMGEVPIELIDLPGVYSLVSSPEASQDEQITALTVAQGDFDGVINVVDACHLERHLYLTSQLLELGMPMVIALTMMDCASQRKISIDVEALASQFACPVRPLDVLKGAGLGVLKDDLLVCIANRPRPLELKLSTQVLSTLQMLEHKLRPVLSDHQMPVYVARRIAEGDQLLTPGISRLLTQDTEEISLDFILADARYEAVHQLVRKVEARASDVSEDWTAKIDRIVLHRWLAFPLFFAMMYVLFFFAIHVGGTLQAWFDVTTDALFVQGPTWLMERAHCPVWLIAWCANGVGRGINTTL